jgi:hypothetical protein
MSKLTPAPVSTRSGRVSKPPERLELIEDVEDDFGEDEYDTDDDCSSDDGLSIRSDSDDDDDDDLADFIVDDEYEDEDEDE